MKRINTDIEGISEIDLERLRVLDSIVRIKQEFTYLELMEHLDVTRGTATKVIDLYMKIAPYNLRRVEKQRVFKIMYGYVPVFDLTLEDIRPVAIRDDGIPYIEDVVSIRNTDETALTKICTAITNNMNVNMAVLTDSGTESIYFDPHTVIREDGDTIIRGGLNGRYVDIRLDRIGHVSHTRKPQTMSPKDDTEFNSIITLSLMVHEVDPHRRAMLFGKYGVSDSVDVSIAACSAGRFLKRYNVYHDASKLNPEYDEVDFYLTNEVAVANIEGKCYGDI